MLVQFDPLFSFEKLSITELAGLPTLNVPPIELASIGTSIGPGSFSSLLASFDYSNYVFKAGLQLQGNLPSFGDISLRVPLKTSVVLPESVKPGAQFVISTGDDYFTEKATIATTAFSAGNIDINLVINSGAVTFDNFDFLSVFGSPLLESELSLNIPGLNPAPIKIGSIDFFGKNFEIIPGLSFKVAPPLGEEQTSAPSLASIPGTLGRLATSVSSQLFGLEIEPIELIDRFPTFAPLAPLKASADKEFTISGENYKASIGYTLISPFVSAGYSLYRDVVFDPSQVKVKVMFGDQVQTGLLGDDFLFTAPTAPAARLAGSISYDLSGALSFDYSLKPTGTIGVTLLGAGIELSKGPEKLVSVELGNRKLETTFVATDAPSFSLFKVTGVEVPDDVLAEQTFNLTLDVVKPGQDIAFVIDTTGSMFDDIDAVKAAARSVINAVFSPERGLQDSRIAVVGYKDPETQIFTGFTEQESVEDRKATALSAINSISVGGGGDFPEAVFHGLLVALNGSIGSWRADATTRRILLFGDAPPNDFALASQVYTLAANTNVAISGARTEMVTDGLARTVAMAVVTEAASEPVTIPVEIFTIVVGSDRSALDAFADIARLGRGTLFNPSNASEVVDALIAAIEAPPPPSNVAPTDITLTPATLAENTAPGTVIGQLAVTDPDAGDTATLALVAPLDDRIILDGTAIKVAPGAEIDFEDRQSIAFNVTATDSAGNSFTKALTIAVTDIAESFIGTAGNDSIRGDAGNNVLQGLAGNDTLDGRRGNDTLTGGAGSDVFVVSTGRDVVTDFFSQAEATAPLSLLFLKVPVVRPGADRIQVGTLASDFSSAFARSSQVGSDTVFDFGSGTQLTLLNTQRAELTAQDFLFG